MKGPRISGFEDDIRRQIEINISTYGRCWLFFDASLLEYLQNDMGSHNSLNMDWLYQYFKIGKIRIFTITRDGIIREICDKDFDFLIESEDTKVLRKNRAKIILNILKGHAFTMEEINSVYTLFKSNGKHTSLKPWLMRKEQGRTNRQLEYGYVRDIRLRHVDNVLNCEIVGNNNRGNNNTDPKQPRNSRSLLYMLLASGLFSQDRYENIYFVDKYDISQYFPGYLKNKELWDYLKTHFVDINVFNKIIRGEYPNYLKDRKKQLNLEDAWDN